MSRWTISGRPMKPLALGLLIANIDLALSMAFEWSNHLGFPLDDALGVIAGIAAAVLFVAWWMHNAHVLAYALLASAGVWITRGSYQLMMSSELIALLASAILSFAVAITAGGAFLLERADYLSKRRVQMRHPTSSKLPV